jgi:hypothetical protein
VEADLFNADRQTDRQTNKQSNKQTNKQDEANSRFSQFANAPNFAL